MTLFSNEMLSKRTLFGGMGGIGIKSIQTGTITIASGVWTGTATVTGVDMNKAVLIFQGYSLSGTNAADHIHAPYIELVDSTTVRGTRFGTGFITTISFMLIEFENVKSIQQGLITFSAATGTATVNEVGVNKSILIFNGFSIDTDDARRIPRISLTNSTTITATKYLTISNSTVAYVLVEFW